jgi:porphobilinogen synthase
VNKNSLLERPRRLRRHPHLRDMLAATDLRPEHLVLPLFVRDGHKGRKEIASMPGQYQLSPDLVVEELKKARDCGIRSFILFGVIDRRKKDPAGSHALTEDHVVARTLERIKKAKVDLVAMADVCFCEYTDHGHCGVLAEDPHETVDNDRTLENLAMQSLVLARAGADVLAPSGMMDGAIGVMRRALNAEGFPNTVLMSYAVKYASAFYGPFRDAVESAPKFGDRRAYQMDYRRSPAEALREAKLDVRQGADIVMVKPGLAYLDILALLAREIPVPLAAYQVSGEYTLIKAAAAKGWVDEAALALETLHAFRRAGAQLILSYFAMSVAKQLK